MGEVLLLLAAFLAGGLLGAGACYLWLRRPVTPAPAPEGPAAAAESEVTQLASASRQLMAELETRYQGRTADDEQPKRRRGGRRPSRRDKPGGS